MTDYYVDQRGLHDKYFIRRGDWRDAPGQKHHGCQLFVLDLDHDPAAREACRAYAAAVADTRPHLSRELTMLLDVAYGGDA